MSDKRLLLASARADLLDGNGAPECPGVPDHVAASWRRSLSHGVHPNSVDSPYFAELDFESRLVRCAQPEIDQLSEQISDMPMCVALTDGQARILLRRDSSQWIGKILDRVYFAKGFGYEEGAVGTNGVGTVLEFGQSVHIVGAEHFVDTLQSFACAGAPVRDPFSGRIEGVLDISCLSDHSTPIMHSLVRAAAKRIEHRLLLDRNEAQQALFEVYSRVDSRTRDAVVAVGPRCIVANTAMQTLLGSTDQEALLDHIRFMTPRHSTVDDKVDLPSGMQVRLRGSTVTVGEDIAGMIGVVTPIHDDVRLIPRRQCATAATSDLVAAEPPHQVASSSPAWRAAETIVRSALGADETVLVLGESGSGRFTLLAELVRLQRPGVRLHRIEARQVEKEPCEIGCLLAEADPQVDLYVLGDVDQLCGRTVNALTACLGERGSAPGLLGATANASERPDIDQGALFALFRQSATLPPLRYRTGDLMALVRFILHELAPHRELQVSHDATRVLGRYRWPGNIRELREVLASTVARRPVGVIQAEDLPAYCQSVSRSPLRQVDQIERDAIITAIRQASGNRKAAAAALGFSRSTLYRKIQLYGITD
ncbi:sigma-54-dependent Fis family transcriptional regulator [Pseudonocardia hispaniensis]|uniref:Sigma-54-dependent Fis family transcriptional regulator n=1 Tax=Pseudonocardia hispaniensis TaxID=904933 RepID=A0ABW1IWV4_9PSEU